MSALAAACAWLTEHGPRLAAGATVVLAVGAAVVLGARAVLRRRQWAGLTLAATAAFLALGVVPAPRWEWWSVAWANGVASDIVSPDAMAPTVLPVVREPARAERHAATALPPRSAIHDSAPPAAAAAPAPRHVPQHAAPIALPQRNASAVPWPAPLFVGGAALSVAFLVLGAVRLRRILRRSRPASAELRRAAAVPARVRVRIADRPVRPFCCGLWRPRIVLPPHLATASPTACAVLRHELAHLRAGDLRAQALAALLLPLLFWHPLYWWLCRQRRFASELLADDAAARGAVPDYVRCMLQLAQGAGQCAPPQLAASVFHRPSDFYRRLEMLMQREGASLSLPSSALRRAAQLVVGAALAVGGALSFGIAPLPAQQPAPGRLAATSAEESAVVQDTLQTTIAALQQHIRQLEEELAVLRAGAAAKAPGAAVDPRILQQLDDLDLRPVSYAVDVGDSIEGILARHNGKVGAELRSLFTSMNPRLDPRRLRVGQQVLVPAPRVAAEEASRGVQPGLPGMLEPPQPIAAQLAELAEDPEADGSAAVQPVRDVGRRHGPERSLGELTQLVTRCIEMRGAVRLAELEFADVDARAGAGQATDLERMRALVHLETRRSQLTAVTEILRHELEIAEDEAQWLEALVKKGFAGKAELKRQHAWLEVLRRAF
ncbi:MAG: M56 family metallopeptidase [Planctomycetota bacterium]